MAIDTELNFVVAKIENAAFNENLEFERFEINDKSISIYGSDGSLFSSPLIREEYLNKDIHLASFAVMRKDNRIPRFIAFGSDEDGCAYAIIQMMDVYSCL